MDKVIVVKIGGATLGSHDTTIEDLVELQKQGKSLVVVHGGGKLITDWLKKHGISSRFVQGERVTDKATLEVVISVLAGLVNKEIVAAINSLGGRAVGLSGVDGAIIQGKVKNKELGYVGSVTKIDLTPLEILLHSGYIPVVAPAALYLDKSDEKVRILNINADIVAGEIAAAVGAESLIFLTDVAGVCDQSGRLLPQLSPGEAEALIVSSVASGGMVPKIKACLIALSNTSAAHITDGRKPHALLREIEQGGSGTTIQHLHA
ncbi:MAG TPA: acetylglutamate kinase [Dehalococcoidales bacterium]|nr:acetylglutamate kinase [Dehalococcoidales bacterium]